MSILGCPLDLSLILFGEIFFHCVWTQLFFSFNLHNFAVVDDNFHRTITDAFQHLDNLKGNVSMTQIVVLIAASSGCHVANLKNISENDISFCWKAG